MNFLVKAAVVAAALGASAAASADQFDFSYTFADGQPAGQNQQITGSFTGTAGTDAGGGLDATNISNIQLSFNGVAFTGGAGTQLILNAWNDSLPSVTGNGNGAFDNTTRVTVYANGAQNNFGISDVDQSVNQGPDYYFNFINSTNPLVGSSVTAFNALQSDAFSAGLGFQFDTDSANGKWTLTDAGPSPVPVPAALPLLLSGLGMLGIARRRRRPA